MFAPRSVAIVGHSMGGLVARALLSLNNFKADLINVLVTQATPHVAPVMPLDHYLTGKDFYIYIDIYMSPFLFKCLNDCSVHMAGRHFI